MKKKNLKSFNVKVREKKALEKMGSKEEVSYNWFQLKDDLNKILLEDKEYTSLKTQQIITLIDDFFQVNKVLKNLQLGTILCLKRHNSIVKEIVDKISILFDNDEKKVVSWFYFINPELEGASPVDYFILGREKEVLDHVNEKIIQLMEIVEE